MGKDLVYDGLLVIKGKISKRDLKMFGYSAYDIELLINRGIIKRVERGVYEVNYMNISNSKNPSIEQLVDKAGQSNDIELINTDKIKDIAVIIELLKEKYGKNSYEIKFEADNYLVVEPLRTVSDKDFQTLYNRLRICQQNQDHVAAENILRDLIQLDNENPKHYFMLCDVYREKKDYVNALKFFKIGEYKTRIKTSRPSIYYQNEFDLSMKKLMNDIKRSSIHFADETVNKLADLLTSKSIYVLKEDKQPVIDSIKKLFSFVCFEFDFTEKYVIVVSDKNRKSVEMSLEKINYICKRKNISSKENLWCELIKDGIEEWDLNLLKEMELPEWMINISNYVHLIQTKIMKTMTDGKSVSFGIDFPMDIDSVLKYLEYQEFPLEVTINREQSFIVARAPYKYFASKLTIKEEGIEPKNNVIESKVDVADQIVEQKNDVIEEDDNSEFDIDELDDNSEFDIDELDEGTTKNPNAKKPSVYRMKIIELAHLLVTSETSVGRYLAKLNNLDLETLLLLKLECAKIYWTHGFEKEAEQLISEIERVKELPKIIKKQVARFNKDKSLYEISEIDDELVGKIKKILK